jgi:hypothetical protein
MRSIMVLVALLTAFTVTAAPMLTPVPLPQQGSCPFGYTSDSKYCTPSNGAKFAILKGPSGSCPSNYSSQGAYCVAESYARFAFVKSSSSCPSGYGSQGDYCVSDR